jgi:hypothetical protein
VANERGLVPKKKNSTGSDVSKRNAALAKRGQARVDRERNMRPKRGEEHSRRPKGQR